MITRYSKWHKTLFQFCCISRDSVIFRKSTRIFYIWISWRVCSKLHTRCLQVTVKFSNSLVAPSVLLFIRYEQSLELCLIDPFRGPWSGVQSVILMPVHRGLFVPSTTQNKDRDNGVESIAEMSIAFDVKGQTLIHNERQPVFLYRFATYISLIPPSTTDGRVASYYTLLR